MGSMGKGQIWINGRSLGRYWPAYKASGSCGACSYAGTYHEKKCSSNCGEASQRWLVKETNLIQRFGYVCLESFANCFSYVCLESSAN